MLALGTVLYLKDGSKHIMICNREVIIKVEQQEYLFDCVGCACLEGVNKNTVYYFNDENIDRIIFDVYRDEQEVRFFELVDEWKKKNKNILKGDVKEISKMKD